MGPAFRFLGIGWLVAICLVGGGLGGHFLDDWLGLSPFLTLVGIALGILVSVLCIYRMVVAVLSENSQGNGVGNGK